MSLFLKREQKESKGDKLQMEGGDKENIIFGTSFGSILINPIVASLRREPK
jgi:hypothetical protein